MLTAFTDAAHYGEHSIHSYVVKNGNRTVLRDCQIESVHRTTQAEAISVKLLLEQCHLKGVKRVCVYTDNQGVVNMVKSNSKNGTIQQIIELLFQTDSDIRWISRTENKIAHKICEDMKRVLDSYKGSETEKKIDPLTEFIQSTLTEARVSKFIHKLVDEGHLHEEYGIEDMGTILKHLGSSVYEDIMKEEADELMKLVKHQVGRNVPNKVKQVLAAEGKM